MWQRKDKKKGKKKTQQQWTGAKDESARAPDGQSLVFSYKTRHACNSRKNHLRTEIGKEIKEEFLKIQNIFRFFMNC